MDMDPKHDTITIHQLESGWYHVRGNGPCEWAQPPVWPCDEHMLREHAFPEASERFIQCAIRAAEEEGKP